MSNRGSTNRVMVAIVAAIVLLFGFGPGVAAQAQPETATFTNTSEVVIYVVTTMEQDSGSSASLSVALLGDQLVEDSFEFVHTKVLSQTDATDAELIQWGVQAGRLWEIDTDLGLGVFAAFAQGDDVYLFIGYGVGFDADHFADWFGDVLDAGRLPLLPPPGFERSDD